MYRIVDHPCLGQTLKAFANYIYGRKDPVTCKRIVVVEYLHNDGEFYPYPYSPTHCPAAYNSTSAATQAYVNLHTTGA